MTQYGGWIDAWKTQRSRRIQINLYENTVLTAYRKGKGVSARGNHLGRRHISPFTSPSTTKTRVVKYNLAKHHKTHHFSKSHPPKKTPPSTKNV